LRYACSHEGEGEIPFDAKWIRQVLLNLVTNSLAASSPGGLISIASVVSTSKWMVSVEDQGTGVPDEQRDQIFERFVRLGKSDQAADKGTGLGLAICRSIVELHGGRIYAASASTSQGLRVIFELPATTTPREGPPDSQSGTASSGDGEAAVKRSGRGEITPALR
jgi:two-component system heavy metal sensor histidine kinase CusS